MVIERLSGAGSPCRLLMAGSQLCLAAILTMRAEWAKTPRAHGLPTPTVSCSRYELCQKRLDWPVWPSLLGLAVPLLLPQLASQSGTAHEASKGVDPEASGKLTLPAAKCLVLQRRCLSPLWLGGGKGRITPELESGGGPRWTLPPGGQEKQEFRDMGLRQ